MLSWEISNTFNMPFSVEVRHTPPHMLQVKADCLSGREDKDTRNEAIKFLSGYQTAEELLN